MRRKYKASVILTIIGMMITILAVVAINSTMNIPKTSTTEAHEDTKDYSIFKKQAQDIAVKHVAAMDSFKAKQGQKIEILSIENAECDGCWIVEMNFLSKETNVPENPKIHVELKDWKVDDVIMVQSGRETVMTIEQCHASGGRTVDKILGDKKCKPSEKNSGDVKGYLTPHICCVTR